MNTTQKGITLLLRSGITGEKLLLPAGFSLEEAFPVLKRHSVVLLAYQGAVNCGLDKADPIMQKMLQIYYRTLVSHEKQMKALDNLFGAFEAHGIAYMPVKGCNIKKLYPKPEMRPMGDVDILIHREDHERIRPIMEELGFQYVIEDDHVFNWKSEALQVELHKSLVPPTDEDYYSYFESGWQLAVKGDGYRYDLSKEDAYLFIFTHFARHYRIGGIGCRHVVDLFVYRRAVLELDMEYISGELQKLRLEKFHENVMRLLETWFGSREEDDIAEQITAFIFSGGNWGTEKASVISQEVKNAQKTGFVKKTGLKAFVRTACPPLEDMTYSYETLRKFPMLLPVFWVIRWFQALFFKRHRIRQKLSIINSIDDESVLSYQKALQAVGLDFHFDS